MVSCAWWVGSSAFTLFTTWEDVRLRIYILNLLVAPWRWQIWMRKPTPIIVAFWSSRLSPSTTRHKGSNPKPALPPTPLGSGWWTGAWSSSWWVQKSGDSLTLSLTSWACEMAHFLCFLILLFAFPVLALKRDTILLFLLFFMTLFGFCDPTNALNSRKVYRHRTTMKLFWLYKQHAKIYAYLL